MKSNFPTLFFLFLILSALQLKGQSHEISVGIMVGKYVPYSTEKIERNGSRIQIIGDSLKVTTPAIFTSWVDKEFYYDSGYEFGYRNIFKLDNFNHLRLTGNLSVSVFRYSDSFRSTMAITGIPDTVAFIPPIPTQEPCDSYTLLYNPERFPKNYRSFQQVRLGVGAEWVIKPLTKRLTIGLGPYLFKDVYSKSTNIYSQYFREEENGTIDCGRRIITEDTKGNNIYSPIHLEARANVQFEIFKNLHIQLEWQKQINNIFKKVISGAPTFYEVYRPRRIAAKLVYRVNKDKKEKSAKE